jgi:hypothetical protein
MRFRKFNDLGVKAFSAYLGALRDNPTAPAPVELLENPRLTEPLEALIEADLVPFSTRMEFVLWLHAAAGRAGAEIPRRDAGFWAWLTLAMFDQVCPVRKGKRKVGEDARYVPQFGDWKRRYRHLLATPYNVFLIHIDDPGRVLMILNVPLDVLGELTEQFMSRQELVSCPGTMALATYLFMDPETGAKRKKASGEAARRLGKLLNQYRRTWDITIMKPEASAAILPRRFQQFVKVAATAS